MMTMVFTSRPPGRNLTILVLALLVSGVRTMSSSTSGRPNIHMTEVVALVKGVAELPCDVTSPDPDDPVRLVLWYRTDSSTPIYSVDTRDSDFSGAEQWSGGEILGQRATFRADRHPAVLILTNLKPKDESLYRCRVDFRLSQTRNAHVNLTVVVPPKRPSIVTKEGQLMASSTLAPLTAGQSLSLSCETSGGRPLPRLVWWRDGRIIDDSYATTFENTVRNDLWLQSLGRQDVDVTLTCEASNSNLTQAVSTSVTIDLYLPPVSVQLVGADQALSAGKEVVLSCLVRGSRPPPLVTWMLDDRTLSEMIALPQSLGDEAKGIIRFTPTAEDRGKRLSCRARNANLTRSYSDSGTELSGTASGAYIPDQSKEDSRILLIHARPEVLLTLGSNLLGSSIKEGDDVYFDCRVSALPPVIRLEWHHNDKKLGHNISAGIIITNQSLVLQRVGRHSAGRYRCIGWNREGETESEVFHLDVKYSPFCRPGQHRVYGVARHEEARITCDLDANPASGLQFRWLFNSSAGVIELPTSTWTADGSRSVARYLPSSDLDFGSLLCSASNAIGQQAASCLFHVIPADKPDPLSNCSVSHQSTDSLQIACNEGFSGGLPQNFLLEIFDTSLAGEGGSGPLESKTNQTSMKPVFIVRGLHADTPYVAYVTAVNAKGRSEPLLVRIVTLRPPETQKNIGSGKSEVDPPRPQPSSSGQISPLVAIITGAITALFLLAALLVVALRVHCRRVRLRAAGAATVSVSASALSNAHDAGGASGAGSETLLLVKSEQLRSVTPLFNGGGDGPDERNPDLIPHQEEDDLLQTAIMKAAQQGAPLAAMLSDLPPRFCTRQLGVALMSQQQQQPGSSLTLGRVGKTRWRGAGPEEMMNHQSLLHASSTLPRPPRPPWTNPASNLSHSFTCSSPTGSSKKESSV